MHIVRTFLVLSIVVLTVSVFAAEPLTNETATTVTREISATVADIRGLPFRESVKVEVVDADAAARHALERIESFDLMERLNGQEVVFRILGLIEPETRLLDLFTDTLREQVGGFYNPSTKTFYLMDSSSGAMVSILAAHELTHALEDQHFDLDSRVRSAIEDDDAAFAVGAVHEGSATLVMTVFAGQALAAGELDLGELQEYAQEEAERAVLMRETPPILTRGLLGAYLLGANFLTNGNVMGVALGGMPHDRLSAAFDAGPVSSEQVLHPEKYWDPSRKDVPLPVSPRNAGKRLGKGWRRTLSGVFGELNLGTLVGLGLPTEEAIQSFDASAWTTPSVQGWGGDRWELWTHDDGRSVVLLATRWDSDGDAVEFEAAMNDSRFNVGRRGDLVAIIAGDMPSSRVRKVLNGMLSGRGR
ncbi:MAG: hypothetical protein OES25_16815 [Acidobacteriota bacterium]|nr:hypothetical protein [Acidobacteriota bacterium]